LTAGVSQANILRNNTKVTATIVKGDRVVQVKIGSKVMLINGASITMDVAPEVKDGRTMRELPLDCPGLRGQRTVG
jgi:hypothetical protein